MNPSPLWLERYAHGEVVSELSPSEKSTLAVMAAEDEEFLRHHPAPDFLASRSPKLATSWTVLIPLAAAFLVLIGFSANLLSSFGTEPIDTRAKGGTLGLLAYHRTGAGTELLGATSVLGKGDEIQLAYFSSSKKFGAIVSIDGRGSVTTHLPLHSESAVVLETPNPSLLPYSYKLDDAPDFETFYLVVSDQPFLVPRIKPFLKEFLDGKEKNLHLPADLEYTAIRVTKKEKTP